MRDLKIPKARTIKEMADLYQVSEEDFKNQIENYPTLESGLKKAFFKGKNFFPKQQFIVFKFLGVPENARKTEDLSVNEFSSAINEDNVKPEDETTSETDT